MQALGYLVEASAFAELASAGWLGARSLRRKTAPIMRLVPIRASLMGSAREPKNASRIFISRIEEAVWMPNRQECKAFIINKLQ
jgi:hypothetical protein